MSGPRRGAAAQAGFCTCQVNERCPLGRSGDEPRCSANELREALVRRQNQDLEEAAAKRQAAEEREAYRRRVEKLNGIERRLEVLEAWRDRVRDDS